VSVEPLAEPGGHDKSVQAHFTEKKLPTAAAARSLYKFDPPERSEISIQALQEQPFPSQADL
jgi:hypothetical protein